MDSTTEASANNTDGVSYQFTETTNAGNVASVKDFIEYKIGIALLKYFSPIVILIGIVGNTLSIVVLRLTSMKHTNSSLYLTALAIFDTCVLAGGLGAIWIQYMFSIGIIFLHEWVCKVKIFLNYLFLDLSAWMLVCVTVDRVILVYLPLRAKLLCTRKKAVMSICLVTFVISGVNCHWFFTVGQRIINDKGKNNTVTCSFLQEFDLFHRFYWPWIDTTVASLLPFTILIIGNFLIIFQLLRTARRRRNQLNVANSRQDDEAKSTTLMLVAISLLFLCLTSPIVFDILIKLSKRTNALILPPTTLAEEARGKLQWAIVNLLMYLNSASNFFMYCLSGKKFRKSLHGLVNSRRKRSRRVFSGSRTTSQLSLAPSTSMHSNDKVGTGCKLVANKGLQASEKELNRVSTISGNISPSDGQKLQTTNL